MREFINAKRYGHCRITEEHARTPREKLIYKTEKKRRMIYGSCERFPIEPRRGVVRNIEHHSTKTVHQTFCVICVRVLRISRTGC